LFYQFLLIWFGNVKQMSMTFGKTVSSCKCRWHLEKQ